RSPQARSGVFRRELSFPEASAPALIRRQWRHLLLPYWQLSAWLVARREYLRAARAARRVRRYCRERRKGIRATGGLCDDLRREISQRQEGGVVEDRRVELDRAQRKQRRNEIFVGGVACHA